MTKELIGHWQEFLSSHDTPFDVSDRKFVTIKFRNDEVSYKALINEEESFFILKSAVGFPVNKSYYCLDKDLFVARLNGVVSIGQFSWKRHKRTNDKILVYKTSQYLIRKQDHREFISKHFDQHRRLLENLRLIVENGKEMNLSVEFEGL